WTWLWGPIGLLLSTPLTVCLMVIGRYVPRLQFLYVMLGNAPVLAPSARFYQRALAHDSDEATEIAEEFLKEHTLEEVYDELVLPALALAERDRERDALTADALATVTETVRGVIDELGELAAKTEAATSNGATALSPPTPPVDRKTPPVLC